MSYILLFSIFAMTGKIPVLLKKKFVFLRNFWTSLEKLSKKAIIRILKYRFKSKMYNLMETNHSRGGGGAGQQVQSVCTPYTKLVVKRHSSICCVWVCPKSLQLCSSMCNPMDCRPPGSSVHGILQARTLQWVAMPSSRGSSWPRDRTRVSSVSCTGSRVLYH